MKLYEILAEANEFTNATGKLSPFGGKPVNVYRQETRELRALDNTMAAELPAGSPLPPPLPAPTKAKKKKKAKNKKKVKKS